MRTGSAVWRELTNSWVPAPSRGEVGECQQASPPLESSPATSPGHTDYKGCVPGAGVSSWSPEGCPGSGAGFVLTDGAGWDPVCSQDGMGGLVAGLPLQLPIPVPQWTFCGKMGGGDPSACALTPTCWQWSGMPSWGGAQAAGVGGWHAMGWASPVPGVPWTPDQQWPSWHPRNCSHHCISAPRQSPESSCSHCPSCPGQKATQAW